MSLNTNALWKLLQELSTKKGLNEIAINGSDTIFVEKDARFFALNAKISAEEIFDFSQEVAKLNGKELSENAPLFDGTLADGSRINIIYPPYAKPTPIITIRKYRSDIQSFEASPEIFNLSPQWITFLKAAVRARINLLVSGGTGIGKTTFLNLLLQEISREERVITIEDTREIHFKIPNLIHLESGVNRPLGIRDLLRNALRMRPDRIIIGEVRGGEVFDLLQAMNSGHDGSMTSIHASNAADALKRITTLYLLAGYDVPQKAIKAQLATSLNLIIQLTRNREGKRIVCEISEITGMEGDNLLLQKLGLLEEGRLKSSGLVPQIAKKLIEKGGLPEDFFAQNF
ncbi:MAG: CpaF family protein [Oligoflexia bacterium]|nr:CpaF family protein [Oligoflexia bacterium]MBF0365392.1 CpaF family protein [Oligoflexia bacterium]